MRDCRRWCCARDPTRLSGPTGRGNDLPDPEHKRGHRLVPVPESLNRSLQVENPAHSEPGEVSRGIVALPRDGQRPEDLCVKRGT